jgi:general secretion pathway protein G
MHGKLAEIRARRGEAGYTLIELLVVLAILGFLAAIATPMVIHYLYTAKIETARTEVHEISGILDEYRLDTGNYPTTQQGLEALIKAPEGAENWNGPYMKKANGLNDPWGHPYNYRSPGQYGEFDLYSYGPEGDKGNTGAKPLIANW